MVKEKIRIKLQVETTLVEEECRWNILSLGWTRQSSDPYEHYHKKCIFPYFFQVDMVLIGAEGVVESGGIINKVGTYTMALSAKEMNKPVYVVAESFKFARLYPLNQEDVPNQFKVPT